MLDAAKYYELQAPGLGAAILIMATPPAALCGRSGRLGRKGGPFLPNLPLLRHKVAGGVAIMRIAGLGADFLDKIDSAIQDISENPERWPIIKAHVRRRLVHRFPYALLYRVEPDEVDYAISSGAWRNIQLTEKSGDRDFFFSLFPEDEPNDCKHEGCTHKTVRHSVMCARHHFGMVKKRPCKFECPVPEQTESKDAENV